MASQGTISGVSTAHPLRIAAHAAGSGGIKSPSEEADQLRERIADLETQLERAERLATLGSMTGSVAHELNNMLTPLLSYAELALKHPDDPDLVQKALQRAMETAQRAAEVTDSLLRSTSEASRSASGSCLLHAVIQDALGSLVRDPNRDGIEVLIDTPDDLHLAISHGAMQQVLMNLILNACDAMRPGPGTLAISAGPMSNTNNTNNLRTDFAVIRVTDTGHGMTPQLLDTIFDPLVTTKTDPRSQQRGGAGLGLTVCRKLISQAGGEISVRSGQGLGTCFSIRIPLVQGVPQIHSAA